jgi:hypothetical protein
MRRTFSLLMVSILSVVFILLCSTANLAQTRDKFVISSKAGGINAITGQASVHSRGDSSWNQLMITDDLNSGDRVRTSSDGRVEILLNPGSYLRLGGDSEVEMSDNTLANLELRLLRGTAIVEATGADGIELNINISTPHTKLAIVRQGLYRVSVVPGDATELIVRKGRVVLGDSHTKVKGGNKVVFSATNVLVAKLTKEEKKQTEEVDVWSKQRGDTLAKANRRITDRMLRSAFASYTDFDPFWRSRQGLWFYNTRAGCYTFLPYFYGWGSPYGSSYSTSIYAGYTPSGWSNRPMSNGGSYGGGQPTSSGGTSSGGNRPAPPPAAPRPNVERPSPRIDSDGTRILRKNMERMPNN